MESLANVTFDDTEKIQSMEECVKHYSGFPLKSELSYCSAVFDSYLCWPPTEAGEKVFMNCPRERLSDPTRKAFRLCDTDGYWQRLKGNETDLIGWSNYTPCFPKPVQDLFKVVNKNHQIMLQIAQNTRYVEMVGFTLSFITLLISLCTFFNFRSLRNLRTKIHCNLFVAMILQVIIRLILYVDQIISRNQPNYGFNPVYGLENTPYICEACYFFLEYAITAMFCWMFIEGIYLHSVVATNILKDFIGYRQYLVIGWCTPMVFSATWAWATSIHYSPSPVEQCWYGYNFLREYWLNQAPRLVIVLINLIFLLNIIRVLIGKLNQSEDSEIEKARKAARAALILLPLLGTTNILNMIEVPLTGSVWRFATWSYITHFLRSFQGFFLAVIYCFSNGEVRQQIIKLYKDWASIKKDTRRMHQISKATTRSGRSMSQQGEMVELQEWPGRINPVRRPKRRPKERRQTARSIERDDTENDLTLLRLYSDRRVLDSLPTIHMDDEYSVIGRGTRSSRVAPFSAPLKLIERRRSFGEIAAKRPNGDEIMEDDIQVYECVDNTNTSDIETPVYAGKTVVCVAVIEETEPKSRNLTN